MPLLCTLLLVLAVTVPAQSPTPPSRIVSIVPAATEMLFAIGAGPQVVGVSSFDRHPPEVDTRVRVGALIDPDVERILSLRPDLVVAYASQHDLRAQIGRASIPVFAYVHGGLADVTATIRALGVSTGHAAGAERTAAEIERLLAAIRARVGGRPRPRTLLVFGRDPGALRNVFASGGRGFLHDMLEAAGGKNVFADVDREAVQASTELILARAPEVILELRAATVPSGAGPRDDRVWAVLASVPAVRDGRVHQLEGDDLVVPGPRVADATRRLAEVLHPEAFGR